MKITNIRVLNNYKVKLTNAKLSGVNSSQSSIFEQGTRTPTIITETPNVEFQEKFNRVFNYLISRYEPGWSAATSDLGKAATMQLLGISSAINPLILGGTVETAFNYTTNGDEGWFDPLTHPKDFASAVRAAYKKFERARSPQRASNKFVQYNLNGIFSQDFLFNGGNAFFGYHPKFDWYPGNSLPQQIHMGYSANYDNCIRRSLIHSPYGNFSGAMNSLSGNWRRYPWLTDRYTAESFQFDMYLMLRESTTVRDLLSDHTVGRTAELGVSVDGVVDSNLNTLYRGVCFGAGVISIVPFNDYGRTGGGYSADRVLVGSPWIRFPDAITYSSWWGNANERAGLCFHYDSLLMFNGSTFPSDPQTLSELAGRPPMTDVVGISYGYGETLLESLNQLSETWGNSMEFIAYLGCLPYGTGFEMRIPFALYKDPTIEGNKEYFKWRLDASVSHWKEKFKSPFDGFAHIVMDASAVVERTYHRWQEPGFTLWTNIASSGASYVENIPVEWARDQYNYTFGNSGPNANKGVVLGVEKFAEYMFKDDVGLLYPNRNDQRRFAGDTNPRHWCLDDDKASDLFSSANDMLLGQRKWGTTYSNSIWGMGVCGSSELGEIFAVSTPEYLADTSKSAMSAFSCFYNTFIEVENDGDIKWKRVPGTIFNNGNDGVPWIHDRRFRLFYLYPTMLALNTTIVDHFHDGIGYYNHLNKSGWYDKTLGIFFEPNMESSVRGTVVSNFPYANRRTPTKPPQNFWTGNARTSEFELLYACMKGGITEGLDSLYFNELHNELVNGLIDVPDTSRTGFFRALDFAVFGASWTPASTDTDGTSLYPSIVPLVKPPEILPGGLHRYRGDENPGSTAGMPSDIFEQNFVVLCNQIPYERRVLLPQYWLLDGPPGQRKSNYFFKKLADGTTYTGSATGITFLSTEFGGTWANGDTNPLRFLTPWAYENRTYAKQSFTNFLKQAKDVGLAFPYVHDDCETLSNFSPGSPLFAPRTESEIIQFASNFGYETIPDARHIAAIVADSRFNGITCSRTNRTFAQEFKHNYDEILAANGLGLCGASAESILSFFIGATDRSDFRYAFGFGFDILRIFYAWNAANYIFCQGDLKSKIIGESLHETTGFENCKVTSSELCTVSASEGKYGVDPGGHLVLRPHIDGYGHSTHSFGELFSYLSTDYGYPPAPSSDPETKYGKLLGWHPVSEGGITFSSRSYQAVVSDIRKVRSILRSRPQALTEGLVVLINGGPGNGSSISVINDSEYFLEHIYHHCLGGIDYFVVFNKSSGDMSLVNQALVEWKDVSGNVIATPCDSTGSTAGLVDRIDLYEVGTNMLVSGAYTNDTTKRLWRMTAPLGKNQFVKQGTSQPLLPDTIDIPSGSRGVWLETPASYGVPLYQSVSAQYTITVSTSGDDAANGVSAAVRTLNRALELYSEYDGSLPVVINIEPGTYELFGDYVGFTGSHSGTETLPVTIRATQQDGVIITGAKTLDVSDMNVIDATDPLYSRFKSSARSNIYKVQLNDFGILDTGVFGNVRYTSPFVSVADGVTVDVYNGKQIGFKDIPTLPEVSFNGFPLTLARFPNVGTGPESSEFSFDSSAIIESVIQSGSGLTFTSPGATMGIFRYPSGVCYGVDYSGISAWADRVGADKDIYVHGFWRFDSNDEVYKIDSINFSTREITVRSSDSIYGIAGTTSCTSFVAADPSPRRWFAINIPEELDAAGEYYISRTLDINGGQDVLYFIPPVGITAGTKVLVSSSRLAGGVTWADGTSEYDASRSIQTKHPTNMRDTISSLFKLYKADNIIIDGLIFDTCSGSAIEINQCKNVQVKNCKIKNMRKNGIVVLDGESVTIDNCDIRDIGLKGVILTGGNRQTFEDARNTVRNCKIRSFGRLSSSNGAAIQLSGCGNNIQRNLIADGNGKGLDYSGNNHVIEFNNFSNLNFYNDDMGAVYKYADPSHAGTQIRSNFFNNIGTRLPGGPYYQNCVSNAVENSCAIYFDYNSGGDRIFRNVFYRCGSTLSNVDCAIFIGGVQTPINGNIFVECTRPATFAKVNDVAWNSLWTTDGIKHSTFNVNGDEWLTRYSGLSASDRRYGYTPYSYFDTSYGEPTLEEGDTNYAGLYNKIDLRTDDWSRTYPWLFGLLSLNGNTLEINFDDITLNTVNNNVCIGTTSGATYAFFEKIYSASGTLYGGFSIGGITFAEVNGASGWFVKYGTDFTLIPSGLQTIKQSLPSFAGISFENIPVYS